MKKLTQLDNGLRVVSKKLENFDSVVLGYWVNTGSVCERVSEGGISHFLEHMVFKGTKSRTAKQIAEEIESVGGLINAYTSKEVTAYHVKVLKEDKKIALDIVSDLLQNSTFPLEELERERGVVLQEISQTNDTPDDVIFEHFQRVAFPDQALGRPVLGPAEVVSKISADDLFNYRNKFYGTGNIVLSAAGAIDQDELIDLASPYLKNFSDDCTKFESNEYIYQGGIYSDIRDLEQTHVIFGFNGVSSTDLDYYTQAIFSSILGGGMSSRLFQEVREKRGLVYSVYTFSSSYRQNGLFGIYAATSPEKLQELAEVVAAEVLKMQDSITAEEFQRTKAQFKASLLMSQESNSNLCDRIANQTIIFGHPIENQKILEKIDAVTIDDIHRIAKKVSTSPATIIAVGKGNAELLVPTFSQCGLIVPN